MAEEESFDALPLDERLAHKSWKARVSAYEQLIRAFRSSASEEDPIFSTYLHDDSILKRAVTDANAVAQEKGVECANAFVEFAGKRAGLTRETVVPSVVDKCLGSTRAGTKAKGIELCLAYIEAEGSAEGVVISVLEGLKAKQPKTVAACVSVLKEAVRQFGIPTIPVKPILKQVPAIFAHTDKTVRAEGVQLVNEIYRFIGPSIDSFLSDLKPVQLKELGEGFQALADQGLSKNQQTRFTRDQLREKAVRDAEQTLGGGEQHTEPDAEEAETATTDLFEPVAILDKLPPDFYEKLASSKWKERKEEALDPLLVVVSVPKIVDTRDHSELLGALAGRMTDANVACVTVAAQCIDKIATGLKTTFDKYRSIVVPPLLERLKEKKQSVVDALTGALDSIALTVPLSDLIEDFQTFAKYKNPQVKCETYRWLVRCLSTTRIAPTPAETKTLAAILLPGLEDSFEPVRAAAQQGMGTLMKILGERAMNPYMQDMDDLRKAKVMEFFEKAEVKCKAGIKPAPAPASVAAKSAPVKKPQSKPVAAAKAESSGRASPATIEPPARPPPAVKAAPKPMAKAAAVPSKKPATSSAPSKAVPKQQSSELKYKYSQEDAEAEIENAIPTTFTTELSSSNWKARLAAMEELQGWLDGGENGSIDAELICRMFVKRPGWKESNFQVFAKVFGAAQSLAEDSSTWSKACAALMTAPASDKLGDIKLKKPASDLLLAMAEKSSLQFVLSQAYDPMTKQKAPKAQADALAWIDQAIQDFGITGIALRDLIEFLKVGLKSTNAAVRASATKAVITLKVFVGPSVRDFVQDLNPTLLATIESEFTKVDGQQPPEPTRFSADLAQPSSGPGDAKSKGTANAADELYPRVDLDKLVPSATFSACNDTNWKTRKEALETIQSILDTNKRIKPSIGELTGILKLRLADSNKAVQTLALDIVARVADGMDKPFERIAKTLGGPVIAVLADQKAPVRAAGVATLTHMVNAGGLDSLLGAISAGLETANSVLRKDLLAWLEATLKEKDIKADLTPITTSLLACLEDRTPEVRKHASGVLPFLVASAGYDHVMNATSSLRPASRSTVIPLIDAAKSTGSSKAPTNQTEFSSSKMMSRPNSTTAKTLARPAASQPLPPPSPRSAIPSAAPSKLQKPLPKTPTYPLPPFKSSDAKAKSARAAKEVGPLRWSIEGLPRPEQVEYLHQQMAQQMSAPLLDLCFSRDHMAEHDHLAALAELHACLNCEEPILAKYNLDIADMQNRMLNNLDLVYKLVSLRMADGGHTFVERCLDLLRDSFSILLEGGLHLSDYEAGCCIPSLVQQLGSSSLPFRSGSQSMLQTLTTVYPASKAFATVFDTGISSRSARIRAASLDVLHAYIQRHGVRICQPALLFPALVPSLSDRDRDVRENAANVCKTLDRLLGRDMDSIIGNLNTSEQSVINSVLGRSEESPETPKAAKIRPPSTILTPQTNGVPKSIAMESPKTTMAQPTTTSDMNSIVRHLNLADITSNSDGISIDALKRVQKVISTQPAELVTLADDIINAVTVGMQHGFDGLDSITGSAHLRLCKHLLSTLTAFFDLALLGRAVSRDVLVALMAELTRRLLETASATPSDAISSLGKVLNMVLIRIFHNSDQSACFGALFVLLENVTGNLRELEGRELADRAKYAELVLKCLWKMSKETKNSLREKKIDVHKLLVDVDNFLVSIPPAEWRRRAADQLPLGDMPLRTCKTILQQVVVVFGPSIVEELESMQLDDASFVGAYLNRLVATQSPSVASAISPEIPRSPAFPVEQSLRPRPSFSGPITMPALAARNSVASVSTNNSLPHRSSQSSLSTSEAPTLDDREINRRLKEIFDSIGQPETSKQGIIALYEFRMGNPAAENRINAWIDATGRHFKSYLDRAMANIATERGQQPPGSPKPTARPESSAPGSPRQSLSDRPVTVAKSNQLSQLQAIMSAESGPLPPAVAAPPEKAAANTVAPATNTESRSTNEVVAASVAPAPVSAPAPQPARQQHRPSLIALYANFFSKDRRVGDILSDCRTREIYLARDSPDAIGLQSVAMICVLMLQPGSIYAYKERLNGPVHQAIYAIGRSILLEDYLKVFNLIKEFSNVVATSRISLSNEDAGPFLVHLVQSLGDVLRYKQMAFIPSAFSSIPVSKASAMCGVDQETFLKHVGGDLDTSTGLFRPGKQAEATKVKRPWPGVEHLARASDQAFYLGTN